MKVNTPIPKVLHVEFNNRLEMNLTMCRLQEFFESPWFHIKEKYFTLGQFIETYANANGNINYFSYWEGFNIPRRMIVEFKKVFKGNISVKERAILKLFTKEYEYLIATDGKKDVLEHELAHARYDLEPQYCYAVNKILLSIPYHTYCLMSQDLIAAGYPLNVHILGDEIHAYLKTSTDEELIETFPSVDLLELKCYCLLFQQVA